MLQEASAPLELVLHCILEDVVDGAGVEVRVLNQGRAELGQVLPASDNEIIKMIKEVIIPEQGCPFPCPGHCMFELLFKMTDVILLALLPHLRDNETRPPVAPSPALHDVSGEVVSKVDDLVSSRIQKFLDTFLNV